MKPFAVVTASDLKYGDFLIEHWLRSLRENVRLDAIEIVVLDVCVRTPLLMRRLPC
jgi:hypothetical protein